MKITIEEINFVVEFNIGRFNVCSYWQDHGGWFVHNNVTDKNKVRICQSEAEAKELCDVIAHDFLEDLLWEAGNDG